jgi:glycosyltransferase involved in cell wall biosynthesis
MPTVSIIMNVHNGAPTLRAALESTFAQTYQDWELIVWDDCSSDDSARIIAEFPDPRVRYFLSPHDTPLGQARDLAIRQAQGEWLAFLDQDDIWLPRKLALQVALAGSAEVGIVYGRTVAFSPGGQQRDYDAFHEFAPLPEGDIFDELLGKGCFIAMSSALIRRAAVEEIGSIPNHIEITPDYFIYLAVSRRYCARVVQEVVCLYRIHPGSMTRVYRRESLEEALAVVEDWGRQLPRESTADRIAGISTALALEEMRHRKTLTRGMDRMRKTGSVWWLVRAPFMRLWRIVHRELRQPYWKKHSAQNSSLDCTATGSAARRP